MISDSQGFLVGEVVADIKRADQFLQKIKTDLSLIKDALINGSYAGVKVTKSQSIKSSRIITPNARSSQMQRTRAASEPSRARDANGRFRSSGALQNSLGSRDNKGRFTSNNTQKNERKSFINGLADKLGSTISTANGMDSIDPSVKAFNEVAQPLSRSFQVSYGQKSEHRKLAWFEKIFKSINLFRKQEGESSKATTKTLEDIEENTLNRSGGGSSLPGKSLLGFAPKLLKKIPLLGALLTGVGSIFGISNTEDSDLSRREKDRKNGSSLGGATGTVGGMLAGAKLGAMAGSFAGPVGAVIGSVVGGATGMFFGDQAGQIIGESIGGWVNSLRDYDIPGKIVGTWDAVSKEFLGIWESIKTETLRWFFDRKEAANNFIKEKTGVDVKKDLAEASNKLKDAGNWIKENTTMGKSYTSIKKKFNPVQAGIDFKGGHINGLTDAQSRALAADTQRTESGGDPREENDYGYIGKYQFSADALADAGFVSLKNLKEAKKKSGKNWFKGGQADFLNNDINWARKGGKEAFLSDSVLQDKAFAKYTNRNIATGMRFGAIKKGDSAGKIAAYAKAAHLKGAGGANKLFIDGIDGTDANGTKASKYAADGAMAISGLAEKVSAAMQKTGTNSIKSPSVPVINSAGKINDAPEIVSQINSSCNKQINVVIDKGDVGQDVEDRDIAHISTGGIAHCSRNF
ncbi:hypothetical protein AU255_02185 [Methyloprofundus sedimenti]|uniref:Phage tail lysozyme domain-containing protein n=2 Tax=Methyloprofundus sedimenti TaxID=1420851 RepID=A0A1V8M5G1_9GAMM|nr:hypothetical protein AU255_02185 [Methyloprofundus sedimenti]